jgi:Uma2 family endonuclease
MSRTAIRIGPADNGRRMRLEEFDLAEGREGYVYELSRGVVTVTNVPGPRHFLQVNAIRKQLSSYEASHPAVIYAIAGGSDCKILLSGRESERHPDLAVYKTAMPDEDELWATWIPELVIEVVSPESANRDYQEKPEEYLEFGVREYWVVDEQRQEMLVHRRVGGRWRTRVVASTEVYSTRILPGFQLNLAAVFAAAGTARG